MEDPVKSWGLAREALRGSMDPATFSRWIEPLVARAADGALEVTHEVKADGLGTRHGSLEGDDADLGVVLVDEANITPR